ncbi:MAG: hypothetical protein WDN48_10710, partial [Pseudolabrys sp.]
WVGPGVRSVEKNATRTPDRTNQRQIIRSRHRRPNAWRQGSAIQDVEWKTGRRRAGFIRSAWNLLPSTTLLRAFPHQKDVS